MRDEMNFSLSFSFGRDCKILPRNFLSQPHILSKDVAGAPLNVIHQIVPFAALLLISFTDNGRKELIHTEITSVTRFHYCILRLITPGYQMRYEHVT